VTPLVIDPTGNDLSYRIIGAAMYVHNQLGSGYKEEVYENALAVELNQRGINCVRQYPVEVWFEDEQVAIFYLDIFVENAVVVEVKAFSHLLTNDEIAQVVNYLKASNSPMGLLFNFGRRKLETRRVFPPKNIDAPLNRLGRDDIRKASLSEDGLDRSD